MPLLTWPSGLPGPSDDQYSWSLQPRVRIAQFNDQYENRTADGVNTQPRSFSLGWPTLSASQKDTLRSFLRARGGTEAFFWTPVGEGTPVAVICSEWRVSSSSGPWWAMTAEFEEVFDRA